ncbi:DNA methyltransferase [Actinomyces faecalis]|uniref:DNA methyltransferase n=1 Tax=Actinomyces faecalis TaxID=2722820 RepID=UPI001FD18366|nr:DNA methyltransferase [Actinomyces faecalis]
MTPATTTPPPAAEHRLRLHDQRLAARAFSQRWSGHGYEKGETQAFWIDLLGSVVGIEGAATAAIFEQKTSAGGFIDVLIPEARTLVEQKASHIDLDKPELRQGTMVTPYQQAKRYADSLPNPQRPDFIVVCNFECFRIHDLRREDPEHSYISFTLAELDEQYHLLDFLIDPSRSRSERERQVSIQAGEVIGRLRDALHEQYRAAGDDHWRDLNVLCVRLVFCLYAEDAGLFPKDAFGTYLRSFGPAQMRQALLDLFSVLDTPHEARSAYLSSDLSHFPYVNGGLFADPIEIPQLTQEICNLLVHEVSTGVDWSGISPTVFGGVFESTLNPETRRAGGMHYTSPQNIHRVIDPLFLDALTTELEDILADTTVTERTRKNRLRRYQDKLASLTFLDPAAGSGNFLTETFICLRRLENKVLSVLQGPQTALEFEGVGESAIKVQLAQFHGIEINDFAASVARTALWIAELQANAETAEIIQREVEDLPLRDAARIVEGNALDMNWNDVLPADRCSYVMGNPPFIGYSNLTPEQNADRARLFGKVKTVDYVACWYVKAAQYMRGTAIHTAFVSTSSICQGQQVTPIWKPLFDDGVDITFAHRSFVWGNEASDQAHVHVVIVGFSYDASGMRRLFEYDGEAAFVREVSHINAYLVDAPDAFIERRSQPLGDVPAMQAGGKPTEGGNLLMSSAERSELLDLEPHAAQWVRRFSMGAEFIKGQDRYCLWLVDCPPQEIAKMPLVRERVLAVKTMREASAKAATRKKAETPWLFDEIRDPGTTYIAIPAVSSERRRYIPMGFVHNGMIPGNKLYFIPTDRLDVFGILMSQVHNAWMRAVAGRLKSDYNYANTIVYNTLVWPTTTDTQRTEIERCAQAVLDARAQYEGASLADLYDPDNSFLYPALTTAHCALDYAVEQAYGLSFPAQTSSEEKERAIVAHLFTLYAETTTAPTASTLRREQPVDHSSSSPSSCPLPAA